MSVSAKLFGAWWGLLTGVFLFGAGCVTGAHQWDQQAFPFGGWLMVGAIVGVFLTVLMWCASAAVTTPHRIRGRRFCLTTTELVLLIGCILILGCCVAWVILAFVLESRAGW